MAQPSTSTSPNIAPRYSITDPYLRFWLRFIERELPAIERLHTEEVVRRIMARWPDVRGTFVEPILRDALERRLPDERLPGATYVGSYWTRKNAPQIDLVGADARTSPASVAFVGSIKWRARAPFDGADISQLAEIVIPKAEVKRRHGVSLTDGLE